MNILFTSSGRRGYLLKYFRQALDGKGKIYAANSSPHAPSFIYADESVVTPLIYDENYISFLLDFCKQKQIDLVIPLFDIDLPVLAKNKAVFNNYGIHVLVSDFPIVSLCNDKWETHNWLIDKGFNSGKTYLDLNLVLKHIDSGELFFPLVIKPRWGMGSIGVQVAEDIEELRVLYRKVKKVIVDSYLKYESEVDLDNSIIIQEKLNGQEYGLDVINNLKSEYKATVVKKKLAMRSGETDAAETVDNPELIKLGERISKNLAHIGNLDVDIFLSNEKYFVLEMNARFGGGYPFSHLAGVNLPKAIVDWFTNPENSPEYLSYKPSVRGTKDITIVEL